MVSLCAQTVRSPDCHTVQCWCFNWGLLLQSIFMNLESSVFSTGPAHLVTIVDISLPAVSWPPFPLSSWHRTSQTLSIVSCPDFISLYFVDDIWVCALNFVFCLWTSVPGPDMVATLDWLVTSGGGQSRWGPTTDSQSGQVHLYYAMIRWAPGSESLGQVHLHFSNFTFL